MFRRKRQPSVSTPDSPRHGFWRSLKFVCTAVLLLIPVAIAVLVFNEVRLNRGIAQWLAGFSASIDYQVEPGAAPEVLPADAGPYDIRLGYTALNQDREKLENAGFRIVSQARPSPRMQALSEHGVYNIYDEKIQAGLQLLDMNGRPIYTARYPRRVYNDFAAIPELVLRALMFVEDRELLDFERPFRNPVVDWDRLAKAVWRQGLNKAGFPERPIGASTVATQLEKIRHSPGGITQDAGDKLLQMISATLRVYRQGPVTIPVRRQLALDYLNALPLAALPGFGEVIGLGDGLSAWFGSDPDDVNRVLADPQAPPDERGRYFKQVLSLILSVRRPSHYLGANTAPLQELTDAYLRRMTMDGVITEDLRDAALAVPLQRRLSSPATPDIDFAAQKGVNLMRSRLLGLLQRRNFYELDRLDLTVKTSLHAAAQRDVTDFLRSLGSRQRLQQLNLVGDRLMNDADPARVIYSMTLYEHTPHGNFLRVNADNLGKPLDINAGAKLDLGSTAKLRTLISWLELIAGAYQREITGGDGKAQPLHARDRLSAWVREYLQQHPGADLQSTLEAAMQRHYSASPAATFYTGGGQHRFANFDRIDNNRVMTVTEAFDRSVNLVFIRMMREIVDHYLYRSPGSTARVLEDVNDPSRGDYLRRFAEREGRQFLSRFYRKYAGKNADAALQTLLEGMRMSPRAITIVLRSVGVVDSAVDLAPWLERYATHERLLAKDIESLFNRYDPAKFDLNDRAYLARVHPLELWLLEYLIRHPGATLSEILDAGVEVRQEVYRWLMKTSRRRAQDRRILDLLEIEAFQQLHQSWARLGYPFGSLTPSLATAIGSSGDRPAALAELMGIILAGGNQSPSQLIEALQFASGTPYETGYVRNVPSSTPVLRPEVAVVARAALLNVAERGTARALQRYLQRPDSSRHRAGGKTGTGDHRYEIVSATGRVVESRVVNRVATFVFMLDDRFFGTITAFVPGADAARYQFTSGLPVRLLGELMPALAPLLDNTADEDQAATIMRPIPVESPSLPAPG